MRILIISKADGSIAAKYNADAPNQAGYGGPWGDPAQFAHMAVPEGMDEDCLDISVVEGEITIEADVAAEAAKVAAALEQAWQNMRDERDFRLKKSDFTQLSDAPLSVEDKALWATYRQELRDLPENTEDPTAVVWPVAPGA